MPSILYIPILYPCMTTERLCVAVDIMKGLFMVSLSEKRKSLSEKRKSQSVKNVSHSVKNGSHSQWKTEVTVSDGISRSQMSIWHS